MKLKKANPPALRLKSIIIKTLVNDDAQKVSRYFFEWTDRRVAKAVLLRVQLYQGDATKPFQKGNAQLDKVPVKTENGKVYFQSVGQIYVDVPADLPIADSFGYYTADMLTKSQEFRDTISEKREDLTQYG